MSDNKKKVLAPDRDRVSSTEPYEVADLARRYRLPQPLVKNIIEQQGPMRRDIEAYLEKINR